MGLFIWIYHQRLMKIHVNELFLWNVLRQVEKFSFSSLAKFKQKAETDRQTDRQRKYAEICQQFHNLLHFEEFYVVVTVPHSHKF